MSVSEINESIKSELEHVKASNPMGRLTPDDVIEFAKDTNTALHSRFEWDDSVAGHKYRLDQARSLIAKVRYEVRTETRVIVSPYYVRDPDAPQSEQGYVSIDDLRSDQEKARSALIDEIVRIRTMLERARSIARAINQEDKLLDILSEVSEFAKHLTSPDSHRPNASEQ